MSTQSFGGPNILEKEALQTQGYVWMLTKVSEEDKSK